jgi:Zn-dependent M28 family amino/carboxypeptidase
VRREVFMNDDLIADLTRDVTVLASEIGERNLRDARRREALDAARDHVATELRRTRYEVRHQTYPAGSSTADNLEVELPGTDRSREIIVVGAHYDTAKGSPGANDNATGVAALLAIARGLSSRPQASRTIRLVAFSTEEPPFTRKPAMGSWVYARRCRLEREDIVAMLSLETIGYYADGHRAAQAPFPLDHFSPWRPDFLAVVGNLRSRELVTRVTEALRQDGSFRCGGVSLPGMLPGVKSSDQWSFWKEGYPAVMLTDTAWLRYRHYHRPSDTVDKLDFARLSQVTRAITGAVELLATTR